MQKARGSAPEISARAPVGGTALDELDIVRLRGAVAREGITLPKGSVGTIVGVWRKGESYEVEFLDPVAAVLTLPALALTRADGAS